MFTRRQKDVLTVIVLIGLLIVTISSCGNADPRGTLVTETYIVQPGDTLWAIAGKYIEKNTAGQRDIREFYHGIIELNFDMVFANRPNSLIFPDDELRINYWQ